MNRRHGWARAALLAAAPLALLALSDPEAVETAAGTSGAASSPTHGAADRCEHPFVATSTGTELTYRWSGEEGEGEVDLRALDTRRAAGAWSTTRRFRSTGTGGERSWTIRRACDDAGAEEPWLGLATAGVIELRDQSWRLPRRLRVGEELSGTVVQAVAGLRVTQTRTHRVVATDRVHTEAGEFRALRVEVEDWTPHAREPGRTVQWIARGPGLVRMEQGGGRTAFAY